MSIRVYRNFRRQCWSVQDGRQPVEHHPVYGLQQVRFHVGKERRDQRRHVHAWARGERLTGEVSIDRWMRVQYDPYRSRYFTDEDGRFVRAAEIAVFDHDGECYTAGLAAYTQFKVPVHHQKAPDRTVNVTVDACHPEDAIEDALRQVFKTMHWPVLVHRKEIVCLT